MEEWMAEDFLNEVWGERQAWVDLPAKVGAYWVPYYHLWDGEDDGVISHRIDTCIRDGESLYFSVAQFEEKGRNIEDVLPTGWLWADLDDVHPTAGRDDGLMPTIAWESSPGRFQALWKLDRLVRPAVLAKLNQALTYHLGADLGGWDLTQVLRLPGTRNFKYRDSPPVQLTITDLSRIYDPRAVWRIVRASLPDGAGADGFAVPTGPSGSRLRMPTEVRALLRVPPDSVVEGERSEKLWKIECLLAEAGWGADDIFAVVEPCAWNKWARRATGDRRLRTEIRKALHHVQQRLRTAPATDGDIDSDQSQGSTGEVDGGDEVMSLPWVGYSSFMAMQIEAPRWMIEDIWTAGSHGIFGGEPKTSKTTLSLALALAVASGRRFLGEFPVHTPGPVLLAQEENSQVDMQDKLQKMAQYYGLLGEVETTPAGRGSLGKHRVRIDFPADVPLRLLNNFGLNLTLEDHQRALWQEIADIRPALVILDPLYLLLPGLNTDKSAELTPYLKWLLLLRNTFGCAIILNHHFRKQRAEENGVRSGQRLLGNTILHGWVDCAIYASRMEFEEDRPEWMGVQLEREFRSMAPQPGVSVEFRLGRPGDIDRVKFEVRERSATDLIVSMIQAAGGTTTARKIADDTGIPVKIVVGRARDAGVEVKPRKYPRGMSYQLTMNGSKNDEV